MRLTPQQRSTSPSRLGPHSWNFSWWLAGFLLLAWVSPLSGAASEKSTLKEFYFRFDNDELGLSTQDFRKFLKQSSPGIEGVRAQYASALWMMKRGEFDQARALLERLSVLSLDDEYANQSVVLKRAECELRLGQTDKAAVSYEAVWGSSARALHPEALLGMATTALAANNPQKALTHLQELVGFFPAYKTDPHTQLSLGLIYLANRRFREALDYFARDPDNPAALYYVGLCQRELDRTAEALDSFRSVMRRFPQSAWFQRAQFELGETFLRRGDFLLSAQAFGELLAGGPGPLWEFLAGYRWSCAQLLMKKYAQAEEGFSRIMDAGERHSLHPILVNLASEALERQKKMNALVRLLRREGGGKNPSAEHAYRLVWGLTARGDYGEAVKEGENFLKTNWKDDIVPKILLVQGYAFSKMDRAAEALSNYQLIANNFSNTPFSAKALELSARAYFDLRRYPLVTSQVAYQWKSMPEDLRKNNPETGFWIGQAYVAQSQGAVAKTFLDTFIKHAPPDHPLMPAAYTALAEAALADKDYARAIVRLQEARAFARENQNADYEKEVVLNLAHSYFNAKDYENAASFYRQFDALAGSQHSESAFALYQQGLALHRSEYYSDAVAAWTKVVDTFPRSPQAPEALFRLAKTQADLGKSTAAVEGFDRLIDRYPAHDLVREARLQIGQTWFNAGQFEPAIQAYTAYLKRYPDDPQYLQVLELLQTAYFMAKKPMEEIERLTKDQTKTSVLAEVYWDQGAKLYNEKKYPEARQYFQKILFEFPNASLAPQASFFRAETLFLQEMYVEAAQAYDNLLAVFPQTDQKSLTLFHLAVSRFNLKEYPKAAGVFERFMKEFPEDPLARNAQLNAALCYAKSGLQDQSIAAYQTYTQAYPTAEDAGAVNLQLAQLLAKTGQEERAITAFRRVTPQHPEYAEALYSAGQLYNKLGSTSGEVEVYELLRKIPTPADPYRIAGLLRLAEIYLSRKDVPKALPLYQDVAAHAADEASRGLAQEQVGRLGGR